MTDYGIKISLPGSTTDSESTEIVIDSSRKTLKVQSGANPAHSDILSHTFNSDPGPDSTTTLFTIEHEYNYTPQALVFWSTDNDTFYMMPATFNLSFAPDFSNQLRYRTTESALIIEFIANGTPPSPVGNTYYIKYYITTEDGVTN